MAQLTDTLAKKFPEITGAKWNRWNRWYAPIMCRFFPTTWDEKVLVVFDPDGQVHLRQWCDDTPSAYFADNLTEGQYVFAVRAISGKVERVFHQRVFNWIDQLSTRTWDGSLLEPCMKIKKYHFELMAQGRCAEMQWSDLGRIYKLGLLYEHDVLRGKIFQNMSEFMLGGGRGVLIDVALEMWASAELWQKALKLEQSERALVGNRAVVQALLSLVEDLEAMPDAASDVARKIRRRALQHLVYEAAREPKHFESVLAETTAKLEQL